MTGLDWIVIGAYFVLIGWVAWWYGRHQKDSVDYFLAGRNAGWVVIGASIFTSNIGSEHIVGLAGQGAATGMAMAHWELHAWCLIVLSGLFVPFYYKSGVQTIPEFLERRFSSRTRWILSCVSLVAYVFTKVSVTVYAGAIVFQALLPDTFGSPQNAFWIGAFSTVIITGVYTVFGGMRAIMSTATPQAVIILVGSFVITGIGLTKLGGGQGIGAGWQELVSTCKSNGDSFALWRPLSDPEFPWLGIIIASPIVGLWYWCTDQYIVQRALSAKDLATARRGALFGGLLKVWPVLIFLIPGMIGWTLDRKFNAAASDPVLSQSYNLTLSKAEKATLITQANARLKELNAPSADGKRGFYIPRELKETEIKTDTGERKRVLAFAIAGDQVFPTMVTSLLPSGIRGLIVACLLAALMSSLASLFNSSASLFTVDIYEKLRPGQTEQHLLLVGRIATATVVGLGMIWIPVMAKISGGGLYQYLQSVQGYLAPPITAVFFLGLFWKRINSTGATWALAGGFVLGMLKLTIQAFFGKGKIENPEILAQIGDFNFLYATGVLFAASAIIMIVASLLTPPPPEDKVKGLTYRSIHQEAGEEIRKSWDLGNKVMVGCILLAVLGMYLYFSLWLK
jgi:SSS family solute:Na+ symporter